MVATIDGKTITGDRADHVLDLGSKLDHELMNRLERAADAILVGAGSARANPTEWNPECPIRIVATRSGDIPWNARYFTGGRVILIRPESSNFDVPSGIEIVMCGNESIDWRAALWMLRSQFGVERLHLMGGSELNAELLQSDSVDELFLTVAPKVKLGRSLPTYAGGSPLPGRETLAWSLVSCTQVENEVFLRYRRKR